MTRKFKISPDSYSPEKTAREILTACVRGMKLDNVFIHAGNLSKGKKTPEKKSMGVMISSV